jgi:hypothetical protein
MAKDYGPNVSGYLDPNLKAYETTVYQASKPVLDKELNLVQDLAQYKARQVRTGIPSGWLSPDVLDTSDIGSAFVPSVVANELEFGPLAALVNDWQVLVQHTNNTGAGNKVSLGAGPAGAGSKRTDIVFLEVWRRLLSASPNTDGKSVSGRIWRNGNVKIATGDDLALNTTDEILDGAVGAETTKRVQIQYRIRVFQGVNLDLFPQGLGDPALFANTVPASALLPEGTASAFTYSNQSSADDPGLWVAGDGNPANGLGTVDGYMYAIPLVVVFRRNTAAFNRDTNMNGGVASPGPSDRPDGLFHDIVASRDVMDLRFHISRTGWDLQELLSKNVNYLFDNQLKTEQYTSPQAGGSVGHTTIWADEIGSVDNPGPELIRNFDSVARRFSDRNVIETVWVRYTPADQTPPAAFWGGGSNILIDPSNLPIYPYPNTNLSSFAPSDISIIDVLAAFQNGVDSHAIMGVLGDPNGVGYSTGWDGEFQGLGAVPAATVTTSATYDQQWGGGSATSPIYYLLVISYPKGSGLTKTPTNNFGTSSFVNETPGNLPAAGPYYYDSMETQEIDAPHREVALEYRTLDQTYSSRPFQDVNDDILFIIPDKVASVTTIDFSGSLYTGVVQVFEDGYGIRVTDAPADWTGAVPNGLSGDVVDVTYQSVRPIPANNIQFTLWYETRAPQTVRSDLLGTTLTVIPRYTSPHMYCITTGSGSQGTAYPFPQQYVQAPGVYPSSGGTFNGAEDLDGTGEVSIANFQANTGFIQIPTLIPAVPEPQNLVFTRVGGDIDAEGRSFFKEVPVGYIPSAWGQPLSDPKKHQNCLPMICELADDGPIGPKGTLLLVMISRWADFDSENKVGFDPDLAENYTSASVYKLKGSPLSNRRV